MEMLLAPSIVCSALDHMGHSGVSCGSFRNLVGLAYALYASPSALLDCLDAFSLSFFFPFLFLFLFQLFWTTLLAKVVL